MRLIGASLGARTFFHLRRRHRRRRRERIGARGCDQAGDAGRSVHRRRRSGGVACRERNSPADGRDRRRAAALVGTYRRLGGDRATCATDPVDGDYGRGRARRRALAPSSFRIEGPRASRPYGVQRRCRRRALRALRSARSSTHPGVRCALGPGQADCGDRAIRRPRLAGAPRCRRRRRALETQPARRHSDHRLGL